MTAMGFLREARSGLARGATPDEIDERTVQDWISSIRSRIAAFSSGVDVSRRACAATLVGVLAGPRGALVIHVGDGAAVVRKEGQDDWIVPSWPFHGEYASTTAFVTDDPEPTPVVTRLATRLDRLTIFSDGLERLVLDHTTRTAPRPFFDRFTAPVAASSNLGLDRAISRRLLDFLDSPATSERTDDDKSLILAVRS